jgi:hypothetical protein
MADTAPAKVNPKTEFEQFQSRLQLEADVTSDDDNLKDWIQGKLGAISVADDFNAINAVMEATGLTPSKELVGRTFVIQDFGTRNSTRESDGNGPGSQLRKYCIVKAVDASTGEEFIIDGGGDQFVAGLVRMRDLYDFPFTGTLLGTPTGSGNVLLSWRFFDPKRPKIQ